MNGGFSGIRSKKGLFDFFGCSPSPAPMAVHVAKLSSKTVAVKSKAALHDVEAQPNMSFVNTALCSFATTKNSGRLASTPFYCVFHPRAVPTSLFFFLIFFVLLSRRERDTYTMRTPRLLSSTNTPHPLFTLHTMASDSWHAHKVDGDVKRKRTAENRVIPSI